MVEFLESSFGSITVTKILLTLLVILILYYLWPLLNNPLSHLPGPFIFPVFGNMFLFLTKGVGPSDITLRKKYWKIYRICEGRQPSVVIADAKKLRQVLVKDFGSFVDRRELFFRGILKCSIFDVGGDEWRRQRHLLTPCFTTGKLKKMQPLMQKCVDRFCGNIGKLADSGEDFESKTYTGMYTMDVIASTGFGMDLDSQADPNNPFLVHARKILDISFSDLAFVIALFTPYLVPLIELLGYEMFPKDSLGFFKRLMKPLIQERQKSSSGYSDMLQMMVDGHKEMTNADVKADLKEQGQDAVDETQTKKGLSDDEIMAQCLLFFLAGFDTTATTLSFLLYQLSQNPDVQQTLNQEVTKELKGKPVTYEAVWKIQYLEQCIMETLRMYPPAQRVDRKCSRNLDIDGLHIPKGTLVIVPIYMMHYDSDVWPEPNKFDPSRFSPEAKALRDQFYHLPFGLGPRQCIGMRLALLEMKMLLAQLVQKIKFLPSKKPFELDFMGLTRTKSGAWIRAERRL